MDDRDTKILRLYGEGKMMKEIATAVGMAPNSIVSVLRRLGVERPTKPQKRWRGREDDTDQVHALWDQGLCATQIAERLGCKRGHVDDVLLRLGVRAGEAPRHRYDSAAVGGSGRSGFRGNMARRT